MVREAGESQEWYGTTDTKRRNYLKRRIVYCVIKCYINNITDYYYINSACEKECNEHRR